MSVLDKYAKNNGASGTKTLQIKLSSHVWPAFEKRIIGLGLTPSEAMEILIKEEIKGMSHSSNSKGDKYYEFWRTLLIQLDRDRAPLSQSWFTFASGVRGISYSLSFARRRQVRAEVYIDRENPEENTRLFRALEAHRTELETALGDELTFEPMDGRRACRIALYRTGTIDDDWAPLLEWMATWLQKFETTFGPKIKEL